MQRNENPAPILKKPFFYDITLRDGNQSLKKPWSLEEKEFIYYGW